MQGKFLIMLKSCVQNTKASPCFNFFREAPEATGEEEGEQDLETPKIYENVSCLLVLPNKRGGLPYHMLPMYCIL